MRPKLPERFSAIINISAEHPLPTGYCPFIILSQKDVQDFAIHLLQLLIIIITQPFFPASFKGSKQQSYLCFLHYDTYP